MSQLPMGQPNKKALLDQFGLPSDPAAADAVMSTSNGGYGAGVNGTGGLGAGLPPPAAIPAPAATAATSSAAPKLPYAAPAAGDLSAGVLENHKSQIGALSGTASGAELGAKVGSVIPVLGTLAGAGIGAAAGAIGGWAKGRTNDTRNARERFAQSQGAENTNALWAKLNDGASPEAAQELHDRALNRIGKHDDTANAQWMQDVTAALAAGKPAPPPPPAVDAAPVADATAAPVAAQSGMGAFAGKMGGFDQSKFADPNRSEKYKIGEVMSRFDPRGGVTPDMLAALNALGIAEFSGSGDQLTLKNTKNDPRMGVGGTADVVKGLKGNNDDTAWSPWFVDDGAGGGAQAQGGGGMAMPQIGGADAMLSGDPQAAIRAAIAGLSGEKGNLAALLAHLRG